MLFAQLSAFAGGGYSEPSPLVIAPGQLITVYPAVGNLGVTTQASGVPLPTTLGGVSAVIEMDYVGALSDTPVPILAVFPVNLGCSLENGAFLLPCSAVTGVTVQIPYALAPPPGGPAEPPTFLLMLSDAQAGQVAEVYAVAQSDAIHVIRAGDTLVSPGQNNFQASHPPAITHADGSAVSPTSPAHIGETVSIWAVGLGLPSSGTVTTGAANPSPPLTTTVYVDFEFRPNAGPSMPWPAPGSSVTTSPGDSHVPAISVPAYFAPGYVGLYQINVTIPAAPVALQPCGGIYQSNVTVNIGGQASYDGAGICVSPE